MEAFKMDFVRPNYKTVGDAFREQEEAVKKAARERGERIGRAEGEKIGRAEGERIGREEGSRQQAKDTARRMLAKNRPLAEIAEFTGLSEEQVKELSANKS